MHEDNKTVVFSRKFAAKHGAKFGFSFQDIINLLMTLFEKCQPPAAEVAAEARNPSPFAQGILSRTIRGELPDLHVFKRRALASELMMAAREESEDDVTAICTECQ